MIKKFFQKRIEQVEKTGSNSDFALRLMFEIAISDGSLDKAELVLIKDRAQEFVDDGSTVSSIVKKIIDETENSTSIYPTIKKINESYSKSEKLKLMTLLWRLVAADKKIDPYEENLYFKIAELIKIKRSEANQIKIETN
ncbi:TerB family tellurite resistance protein [Pseudomonadota bacterium]|nr:TerB family tellurite resistance protein [Pseudomonadota bacterium]